MPSRFWKCILEMDFLINTQRYWRRDVQCKLLESSLYEQWALYEQARCKLTNVSSEDASSCTSIRSVPFYTRYLAIVHSVLGRCSDSVTIFECQKKLWTGAVLLHADWYILRMESRSLPTHLFLSSKQVFFYFSCLWRIVKNCKSKAWWNLRS